MVCIHKLSHAPVYVSSNELVIGQSLNFRLGHRKMQTLSGLFDSLLRLSQNILRLSSRLALLLLMVHFKEINTFILKGHIKCDSTYICNITNDFFFK